MLSLIIEGAEHLVVDCEPILTPLQSPVLKIADRESCISSGLGPIDLENWTKQIIVIMSNDKNLQISKDVAKKSLRSA